VIEIAMNPQGNVPVAQPLRGRMSASFTNPTRGWHISTRPAPARTRRTGTRARYPAPTSCSSPVSHGTSAPLWALTAVVWGLALRLRRRPAAVPAEAA
jgi:hypothetical protein